MAFDVREYFFLKGVTIEGVFRFGKKGKLSPRFIGPSEILERVGIVAYCVALQRIWLGYTMCTMCQYQGST